MSAATLWQVLRELVSKRPRDPLEYVAQFLEARSDREVRLKRAGWCWGKQQRNIVPK